jgi:hypothetical protein
MTGQKSQWTYLPPTLQESSSLHGFADAEPRVMAFGPLLDRAIIDCVVCYSLYARSLGGFGGPEFHAITSQFSYTRSILARSDRPYNVLPGFIRREH